MMIMVRGTPYGRGRVVRGRSRALLKIAISYLAGLRRSRWDVMLRN